MRTVLYMLIGIAVMAIATLVLVPLLNMATGNPLLSKMVHTGLFVGCLIKIAQQAQVDFGTKKQPKS